MTKNIPRLTGLRNTHQVARTSRNQIRIHSIDQLFLAETGRISSQSDFMKAKRH